MGGQDWRQGNGSNFSLPDSATFLKSSLLESYRVFRDDSRIAIRTLRAVGYSTYGTWLRPNLPRGGRATPTHYQCGVNQNSVPITTVEFAAFFSALSEVPDESVDPDRLSIPLHRRNHAVCTPFPGADAPSATRHRRRRRARGRSEEKNGARRVSASHACFND